MADILFVWDLFIIMADILFVWDLFIIMADILFVWDLFIIFFYLFIDEKKEPFSGLFCWWFILFFMIFVKILDII